MKSLVVAVFFLLLMSCDGNNIQYDNSEILGQWRCTAREDITSGIIESHPGLDSVINVLEFGVDTVMLHFCGRECGLTCGQGCGESVAHGDYTVDNRELSIDPFYILEGPINHEWMKVVWNSARHSVAYTLSDEELKIITDKYGDYHTYYKKVVTE